MGKWLHLSHQWAFGVAIYREVDRCGWVVFCQSLATDSGGVLFKIRNISVYYSEQGTG